MKLNEIAAKYVKIMDSEDYEPAKQFLANDCCYKVGELFYMGPDAIIEIYRSHHDFAKSTFDSIIYKSEVSRISEAEFEVVYFDIITHGKKTHTYKCKQFFCFNTENKITKITHENIPGEYEQLKIFYKEVGV
jgi:hypothetical protein